MGSVDGLSEISKVSLNSKPVFRGGRKEKNKPKKGKELD